MNIALWLKATAQTAPLASALLDGMRVVATYEQFARSAGSIAEALTGRYGIEPGDRVAVFMPNCTDYLACLYGIWGAGAIAVPVNAKLGAPCEVGHVGGRARYWDGLSPSMYPTTNSATSSLRSRSRFSGGELYPAVPQEILTTLDKRTPA